jgi:hypothetical protein
MAVWNRIRDLIDNLKTILDIFGWLGLSASVGGIIATVSGVAWAIITGMSAPFVITAGFCTFTGAVYLGMAPMAYRALRRMQVIPLSQKPNHDLWRQVPNLHLLEAACLLADAEPNSGLIETGQPGYVWFRTLCEAIVSKEIEHVPAPQDQFATSPSGWYQPYPGTVISRDSLLAFARKRKIERPFLAV